MKSSGQLVSGAARRWVVIVVCLLLGALGGWLAHLVAAPQYQSSSQALVVIDSLATPSDRLAGSGYVASMGSAYAEAVVSPGVLDTVIAQLALPTDATELAHRVQVDRDASSPLLGITVTAETAELAQQVNQAILDRFAEVVPTVITPPSGVPPVEPAPGQPVSQNSQTVPSTASVQVLTPPTLATRASGPTTFVSVLAGAAAGLVVGIGVALWLAAVDRRLSTVTEVGRAADAPVLALVRRRRGERDDDAVAGSVHAVARAVLSATASSEASTVLFASTSDLPAASELVAGVAESLSRRGSRVIALDAALRRARLHRLFGIAKSPGLGDVLEGRAELRETGAGVAGFPALRAIPAGESEHPSDALLSTGLAASVADLAQVADVVLVDAGDLDRSDDALSVAQATGAPAVLVVGLGSVTAARVRRYASAFADRGGLVGVVVVDVPVSEARRADAAFVRAEAVG
ncbi:hypothetical protein ET445_01540 [Agromyces protaetiae]|uniref:Polysaccharide chain length determinant N-terminal domain-containing protein n=1 Tax=Agromyces protaetiae TaxID=2509455 RepID=A0A4P6F9I0_9MICO|nr:hypothetical protein [Agromyces protaetiae]QAY72216.1 hypothetical protein ET445_01540 [Agromyces protaetiae]